MSFLLKLISIIMVWGVVGYMILYVDPETVRDLGLTGMYLPFVVSVTCAVGYTTLLLVRSWLLPLILATLTALALVLSLTRLMSTFTLIIIILIAVFFVYLTRMHSSVSKSDDSVR